MGWHAVKINQSKPDGVVLRKYWQSDHQNNVTKGISKVPKEMLTSLDEKKKKKM